MASDLEDIGSAAEAAAARIRRRYPTREPDPRALAASQGKVTFGDFLGDPQAEATSLFYGGDYNPRSVLLSSLGVVGAPAAVGGVPLGALGSGVGKGIRAYHGSPHDFERFDISKIGTGEGAQAYGHGLYFAEKEGTARSYRDALAGKSDDIVEQLANQALMQEAGPRTAAQSLRQRALAERRSPFSGIDPAHMEAAAAKLEGGWEAPKGRMYEVNINAAPEQFLDWDKPLAGQSVARSIIEVKQGQPIIGDPSLGQAYSGVAGNLNRRAGERGVGPVELSNSLAEAGIPGIRYLDQGSRSAGAGSSNYVVFNDKLIDILRKYALAGVAPPAALTAAAQYQEPQ